MEDADATRPIVEELEDRWSPVADLAMELLYEAHPEWAKRLGPRGRELCREDLGFHKEALVAAVTLEAPGIFERYTHWLVDLLGTRGMSADHVVESYEALASACERTLSGPAGPLVDVLRAGMEATNASPPADQPAHDEALTEALLTGDPGATLGRLDELTGPLSPAHLADGPVRHAMTEVGRRWQQREITVAHEHLATATLERVLVDLHREREHSPPQRGHVLLACIQGNRHTMGLRLAADALEAAGWETTYLGGDVPRRDLLDMAERLSPDVVALSVAMESQLPELKATLEALAGENGDGPRVVVGGRGVEAIEPPPWLADRAQRATLVHQGVEVLT